jgi:hypothetical protein
MVFVGLGLKLLSSKPIEFGKQLDGVIDSILTLDLDRVTLC